MDIIRKVNLTMNEQKKYEIIKKLVETNGNKSRAAEPIPEFATFLAEYFEL